MPDTEKSRENLNGQFYSIDVQGIEYYTDELYDREYVATTTTYLFGEEKYTQSEPLFIPKIFRISMTPKHRIVHFFNWDNNDFVGSGEDVCVRETQKETVVLDNFSANIPLRDEDGEYTYYDKVEFDYFENLFVMGVRRQGFRYELNIPKLMEKVALMLAKETKFTDDEIVEAISDMMRKRHENSIFKTL